MTATCLRLRPRYARSLSRSIADLHRSVVDDLRGSVCVTARYDSDDCDGQLRIVDAVDDAVGAASCAVSVREGRLQSFADALRIVEERTNDELVGREGDCFWE